MASSDMQKGDRVITAFLSKAQMSWKPENLYTFISFSEYWFMQPGDVRE